MEQKRIPKDTFKMHIIYYYPERGLGLPAPTISLQVEQLD